MRKNKEYKTLLSDYLNANYKAIWISGNSGLGKSEIIKSVCKEMEGNIWINYNFALYESSFKEILASIIRYELISKNYDISLIYDNSNVIESIFRMINYIDNSQKIIFSFENISEANEFDIKFICELLNFGKLLSNVHIIIEEDKDCINKDNFNIIKSCIVFKTISVSKYNKKEISEYICEQFNCRKLKIQEKDMEHIYIASEGILSITNVIINELEQLKLIKIRNDIVIINPLPSDFLINGIEPYILKRFEMLKDEYKVILAKTSCLGFGFNCEDMFGIFSIAKIFSILKTIQNASHLITEIENEEFCFESVEAYNIISNKVDQYLNKAEIIKKIADYYKHSLTEALKGSNYAKYIKNLSLAKELYETINDTPNILNCYELLIGNKMQAKLFSEALLMCLKYEKFCVDEKRIIVNNIQKMICYIELENYVNGRKISEELIKSNLNIHIYLKYCLALCLYGESDGKKALDVLKDLSNTINKDKETLLYIKTKRLMSSIYDFYDEWEYQLEDFTEAITICKEYNFENEYYSMLRQAGMVYPYPIALSMYRSAEKYFLNNNNIKELAKVTHNIATDSMYMMDLELSHTKCAQSIQYFKTIGNNNITNPLNLMGILLCLSKKDFKEALSYFDAGLILQSDKWTQCVINLNLSTVYRKMGNIEKCLELLDKVNVVNNDSMPIITVSLKICELLYFFEQKLYNYCKEIIAELINKEDILEYRHKYVIIYILSKIGDNHIILKNDMECKTNFINSTCSEYLNKCLEDNCYWATTRFWEN